jgi:hypothetical protein
MKLQHNKIDLDLRLAPSEAWRRITETSDLREIEFFARSRFRGDKPFHYRVYGSEINIQKRRNYRNDFSSSLTMKIEPTDYGCKLRGRFSAGIVPMIFIVCWLTILGNLSLVVIIDIFGKLSAGESLSKQEYLGFTPVVLFVFGLAMFFFARFVAKSEERAISVWLDDLFADSIIKH